MTPDSSLWRLSVRYEHIDDLTASDLAWEWLRRNDDYDHDYEKLGSADADQRVLIEKIRREWGLRFPDRSPARST